MATLTQVRETTRFLEASSRSRMLAAGAAQVMPDGITRETIRRQPYAPAMASAHGSVLVDVDGDERTDLLSNHTALVHGHGYGPVAEVVARQSRQLEAMPVPRRACLPEYTDAPSASYYRRGVRTRHSPG